MLYRYSIFRDSMSKVDDYRKALVTSGDREAFLLKNSGLPGPRGNIELAKAAVHECSEADILRWAGSDDEYLAFCGTLGLGRLVLDGKGEHLKTIKDHASDGRWRVREAVAMALQMIGEKDIALTLVVVEAMGDGNAYEKRAAIAGICEPVLLKNDEIAERALRLLDSITRSIGSMTDRKSDGFIVLRKGLAYCWSVAVAANPDHGKPMMEKWLAMEDKDIRWIMKENLKKNRLAKMDAGWVEACKARL